MAITESTLAPIERDAAYPLPLFSKLTGLGEWGVRRARARGLRVRRSGRRVCSRRGLARLPGDDREVIRKQSQNFQRRGRRQRPQLDKRQPLISGVQSKARGALARRPSSRNTDRTPNGTRRTSGRGAQVTDAPRGAASVPRQTARPSGEARDRIHLGCLVCQTTPNNRDQFWRAREGAREKRPHGGAGGGHDDRTEILRGRRTHLRRRSWVFSRPGKCYRTHGGRLRPRS